MAKKRNIKVTPNSTADRPKPKPKAKAKAKAKDKPKKPGKKPNKPAPKPKPQPVEDKTGLKKWDAYERAVAEGRERKFLKQNPGFRAKAGLTLPAKTGQNKLTDDSKVGKVLNVDQKVAAETARQAGSAQNVASYDTAFGSAGGYYDADGRYHMTQEESDSQRAIREGGEALSQQGVGLAQENLNNYEAFNWQGSPEERARIEEEVYGRLTRNVDRDYQKEFEQMEQRLYNRGVPLNPKDQAYKDQLDALNEKYANIKENAQSQAVQMGGEEMARSFGIGLGGQQQRMAETNALQQMGIGYQGAPELGFNAPEFNQTSAADLWSQTRGQNQAYKVGMENAKAGMMSAEAAMMNAKNAGSGEEEENIPT